MQIENQIDERENKNIEIPMNDTIIPSTLID